MLYMGQDIFSPNFKAITLCSEAWDSITHIIVLACIATPIINDHKITNVFDINSITVTQFQSHINQYIKIYFFKFLVNIRSQNLHVI